MKAKEALLLARKYNENGNYRYALSILKPLYKKLPNNVTVLRELSDALLGDGQQPLAIKSITKAIHLSPKNPELWISRSWMHSENAIADRISDLEHALALEPQNDETLATLANTLIEKGDIDTAYKHYQKLLKNQPNNTLRLLEARAANLTRHAAATGDIDDPSRYTIDNTGIRYSISHLEKAADDYSLLIDKSGGSWHYYFKRGEIYKHLHKFENALMDFELALDRMEGKNQHIYRELIQDYQQQCHDLSKNPRQKLSCALEKNFNEPDRFDENSHSAVRSEQSPNQAISSTDSTLSEPASNASHRKEPPHLTKRAIQDITASAVNQAYQDGEDTLNIEEFISEDPKDIAALSIARSIYSAARMDGVYLQHTDMTTYPKGAKKHCKNVAKRLADMNFSDVGDFTSPHLNNSLGKPVLIRLLASEDALTIANILKAYPAWPGFTNWLKLSASLQWKKPNIIRFHTQFSDDSFLITENTAGMDPLSYGPKVRVQYFSSTTPVNKLLDNHKQKIEEILETEPGIAPVQLKDNSAIIASHALLQKTKAEYRRSIRYVTDEELMSILAKQYRSLASNVKAKLDLIAETSI